MSGYMPQRYGMGASMFPSFGGGDMFGLNFGGNGGGGVPAMSTAFDMTLGGVTGPGAPGVGGGGIFGGMTGMDKLQLGISGLGTIGNLWSAFQAQKLAKDQFKYTKNVTDTNLANQLKTYNTALTDRANNRAIVEGRSADETRKYIDANSLRRFGK